MKHSLFSDTKFKFDPLNIPTQIIAPVNVIPVTEELIVLDKNKINECFQIILKTPNESLRKEADNFLFLCEKNSMYYSFLLEIFESTQVKYRIFDKTYILFKK